MPLRLIIADDDALARALIEAIVERDRELELVGSATGVVPVHIRGAAWV